MTFQPVASVCLGLLVASVAGCSDPVASTGFVPERPPASSAGGLDSVFARIQQQEPAFAGMYSGGPGAVVVLITDLSAGEHATALVAALLVTQPVPESAPRLVVKVVQYNFGQLLAWKAALLPLMSKPFVTGLDIDERANCVSLGVAPGQDLGAWQDRAEALGVPHAAIAVVHGEAPVAEAGK